MFKRIHVFRVKPGKELLGEIKNFCTENKITSGIILSIIGSLNSVELGYLQKLPGKYISKKFAGPLEIVNGTGSVALGEKEVLWHIHLTIASSKQADGGHLIKGEVFSTAEVVIGELDCQVDRYFDKFTGLNELKRETTRQEEA